MNKSDQKPFQKKNEKKSKNPQNVKKNLKLEKRHFTKRLEPQKKLLEKLLGLEKNLYLNLK